MVLSNESIRIFSESKKGLSLNSYQLRLLGIGYPPKVGWLKSLIGTEIAESLAQLVVDLRGQDKRRMKQTLSRHGISAQELFCKPL